jgi:uncharacterized protein YidB (DUF937 family)
VDRDEAAEEMSKALPEVVDKLTPNGEIPPEGDLSRSSGRSSAASSRHAPGSL